MELFDKTRIYFIAEFSDGIQLLPRKWVGRVNGELKCKYPNHIEKEKQMKLAVRHMIDPQSTWDIVDVIKILGSSVTYERGLEKLNQIVRYNLSSITTSDAENTQKKTRKIRAKKTKEKYGSPHNRLVGRPKIKQLLSSPTNIPPYPICHEKTKPQNSDHKRKLFPEITSNEVSSFDQSCSTEVKSKKKLFKKNVDCFDSELFVYQKTKSQTRLLTDDDDSQDTELIYSQKAKSPTELLKDDDSQDTELIFNQKAKSPTGLLKDDDNSQDLIFTQYSPLTHGRHSSSSPNYFDAINDNNFGPRISNYIVSPYKNAVASDKEVNNDQQSVSPEMFHQSPVFKKLPSSTQYNILSGGATGTSTKHIDQNTKYFQALLRGQANIISKLDELLESRATMINHQEEDSTFSSKYKKLLPCANENQLKELENELKDKTFVRNLCSQYNNYGGQDYTVLLRRILEHSITDELGCEINFTGKKRNNTDKKKIGFVKLYLYQCILDTVQKKFPSTTPDAINIQVTSYLRHSKERLKKKLV
ncbi:uncharacterized protein LOC111027018 isoform X2 [Myzus persicae]|uniref:uncharacterized protein LOC111027018 isoform X2 n=1 Tax=Myzus persicae TaxID=13164 RepID=UPI000B939A28|nr:uncharacterized protein LOC111027018 isoform X2 [Myzus persicae]